MSKLREGITQTLEKYSLQVGHLADITNKDFFGHIATGVFMGIIFIITYLEKVAKNVF